MNATGTVLFVRAEGGDRGGPDALDGEFDVAVAEGPVDAMKRLATAPAPDCLVTSASLPDLPLDAFLDRVRTTAPDTAVLVVGELPSDRDVAAALPDADAYLPPGRADGLAKRLRRVVAARRVERSVGRHERLARTVAQIAVAVAGATDRRAVEAAFHDELVAGDWYRHVWVARRDDDGGVDVQLPVTGRLGEDELATVVGGGDPGFLARAIETGRVVDTGGRVPVRSAAGSVRAEAVNDGGEERVLSTAAVPFAHDGQVHGVGVLSTDRPGAFDGAERALLADVGAILGHALWAIESDSGENASEDPGRGMENLVHDLRNPLGIARSHLQIAREDDEPASLERVAEALDRMVDTVDRVATGLGGEPGVETTPDDLAAAAEVAWGSIESRSASLEVADSARIRADHDLLVRLLSNLFQNAIDHAGEAVTVTLGTTPGGFYVEDDGPGIPASERESVVERGYSTSDDGLGIGLSIVEDVASAHGWTLSVGEADDGGARFELSGVERVEAHETR